MESSINDRKLTIFSNNLKFIMEDLNITQADIARGIGASSGNVSMWINGSALATYVNMARLGKFLVVTPEFLTTNHGSKISNTIASRIKFKTKSLNLSKSNVFNSMGVTYYIFTGWIKGKKEPSYEQLSDLAEILQTTPKWLMDGSADARNYQLPNTISDDSALTDSSHDETKSEWADVADTEIEHKADDISHEELDRIISKGHLASSKDAIEAQAAGVATELELERKTISNKAKVAAKLKKAKRKEKKAKRKEEKAAVALAHAQALTKAQAKLEAKLEAKALEEATTMKKAEKKLQANSVMVGVIQVPVFKSIAKGRLDAPELVLKRTKKSVLIDSSLLEIAQVLPDDSICIRNKGWCLSFNLGNCDLCFVDISKTEIKDDKQYLYIQNGEHKINKISEDACGGLVIGNRGSRGVVEFIPAKNKDSIEIIGWVYSIINTEAWNDNIM